jgi:hypothetical protein
MITSYDLYVVRTKPEFTPFIMKVENICRDHAPDIAIIGLLAAAHQIAHNFGFKHRALFDFAAIASLLLNNATPPTIHPSVSHVTAKNVQLEKETTMTTKTLEDQVNRRAD